MGLDQAYIRRVLLRVLDGEEYDDILLHYTAHYPREFKPDVPKGKPLHLHDMRDREDPDPKAQVRITDLRVAKDLGRKDPGRRKLRSELKAEVSGLRLPFTTDDVLRWKWKTLLKPKRHRTVSEVKEKKEWYEEECLRIRAISFAAAALCLSVDLGQENLEELSHDGLTEIILSWHKLISNLISALDDTVDGTSKLLAGRKGTKGGRPPDPELKSYTALFLYRMGHLPNDIAAQIGLNKKVNPNWKSKLYKVIEKGIEIEQEKFPLAAEVFARRDEKEIRESALAAYANYDDPYLRGPEDVSVALEDGGDLIGMPANETDQGKIALIQLGSCIKWGLDPLSPNLD
jgi:hypothetical protein